MSASETQLFVLGEVRQPSTKISVLYLSKFPIIKNSWQPTKKINMKTLEEIRRVKEEVEPELLKLPGVTGVDVGYKYVNGKQTDVLSIRIYVENKRNVPEQDVFPQQIQNIPTDVIERRFVLHSGNKNFTLKN